jgi:hypothetical protein
MAESDDQSSSWPGFLSELSKGFLILRDVFGYALPGAIFLGVGLLCRRFSLGDLQYYILRPYHPPAWLIAVVGLGACYAIGHVMAAIAYFPYNFKKQTDVPSELILARGEHPELLIELDRQSTMTMMRGSTGVALVLGSICFWWFARTPSLGWMLAGAGALLLLVFYWSAMPHIGRLSAATSAAAKTANASAAKSAAPAPAPPPALKQVLQDAATNLADNLKKL